MGVGLKIVGFRGNCKTNKTAGFFGACQANPNLARKILLFCQVCHATFFLHKSLKIKPLHLYNCSWTTQKTEQGSHSMSQLTMTISHYWDRIQGSLFPWLAEELDPITEKQQQLVEILELVRVEEFLPDLTGCEGRPPKTRSAIARSFVAKMIYNMDSTVGLIERLKTDKNMRRICGWESLRQLPSESTFSRAFAEFAETKLPQRTHDTLIAKTLSKEVISHNSRDSTAIAAREKPCKKSDIKSDGNDQPDPETPTKKKKGRPKKGEKSLLPEPTRIEKQKTMSLEEMLNDLPKTCNKGAKKDSKGNTMYWTGYKLHLDTVDAGIPVSAIVTSASLNDSQVALPLATLTAGKITNLYDLMDAGYDVDAIAEHSRSLGHVPLIDKNPRRDQGLQKDLATEALARRNLNFKFPEELRYNERTTAERTNARLKDEFGANKLRVRGHAKAACHLMFGVLVLAADQLMKLAT